MTVKRLAEFVRAGDYDAIDMIYGAAPQAEPSGGSAGIWEGSRSDDLHINDLLELVIHWRGSDLHLASGSPPVIRVNGDLRPITEIPILNGSQIRQMIFSILAQKQREKFENELELDTSYALPGKGRFQVFHPSMGAAVVRRKPRARPAL